jgi:2-polyprenyl-3-methyl-5-hydroxy-6-metoxy-1,4-benzoquinol methylase
MLSRVESSIPDLVFVLGMYASGLETVASQFACLGLPTVSGDGLGDVPGPYGPLSQLNNDLLSELGATWTEPALLPRLELGRRLAHRQEEARNIFKEATSGAENGSTNVTLVWADPRNTLLAPFWIETLHVVPSVVLVHRHPLAVGKALAAGGKVSFEDGLVLWDEYNRMALSLWEELDGVIVGIDSFENDVPSGVQGLRDYLARNGIETTADQAQVALHSFHRLESEGFDQAPSSVPNKFLVLDRVLSQADLASSVDHDAMVAELANYYDEDYYYSHCGSEGDAPYRRGEEQWETFFAMLARRIAEELQPMSVLDAGCAIGFLVEALRGEGIDAWGLDISDWAISQVPKSIRPYCSVASLTDELSGHFDLVTLIEVMEHLPDSMAEPVIANITRHSESVLFSSTSDDFEEVTHINVRTLDYWAQLFAAQGFVRDFDYDASYLSKDAVLFRRGDSDPATLVVGYEQSLWRAREESAQEARNLVRERDELLSSVRAQSERAATLEQFNDTMAAHIDELQRTLQDLERQRNADELAVQRELLRRDRDMSSLSEQHNEATRQTEALAAQISAIETTKVFRYTARLRSLYGKLRKLAGAPRRRPPDS